MERNHVLDLVNYLVNHEEVSPDLSESCFYERRPARFSDGVMQQFNANPNKNTSDREPDSESLIITENSPCNSVEIETLVDNNWSSWSMRMQSYLIIRDIWIE